MCSAVPESAADAEARYFSLNIFYYLIGFLFFFFFFFFFSNSFRDCFEGIIIGVTMQMRTNFQKMLWLAVWTCAAVAEGSHPVVDGGNMPSLDLGAPKYILTILADDYGWHNIGFHNNNITSPHMDDLAAHGVRLRRHYVYVWHSERRC